MKEQLKEVYKNIINTRPLVHNITNYVTVNDCANIQLAFNGSPIMADSIDEVDEVVGKCSSLVLNIGTLNRETTTYMLKAGREANKNNIPIILDPVGYGFTKLRTEAVDSLLDTLDISIIKGNISEIKGILHRSKTTNGVDAGEADSKLEIEDIANIALKVSNLYRCVVIITSKVDVIAHIDKLGFIHNGHRIMSDITGTGCMISAMLGVAVGANKDMLFDASMYTVGMMGVCGEMAYEDLEGRYLATLKLKIIDNVASIKFEDYIERLNYEIG